jgi:hypothetical protein
MMQILLHFVLLTAPQPVEAPSGGAGRTPRSPSKERKPASSSTSSTVLSPHMLEEQLEMFMDRLTMWQLMGSLDDPGAPGEPSFAKNNGGASTKGKGKQVDERDWMQAFCEDVVEAS